MSDDSEPRPAKREAPSPDGPKPSTPPSGEPPAERRDGASDGARSREESDEDAGERKDLNPGDQREASGGRHYDAAQERRIRQRAEKARRSRRYWQPPATVGSVKGPTVLGEAGVAAGRDVVQNFFERRQGAHAWVVGTGTLERLRREFVATVRADGESSTLDLVVARIASSHVVLVVGPQGSGRAALALRALDRSGCCQGIHQFDAAVPITALDEEDFTRGCGYLLIHAGPADRTLLERIGNLRGTVTERDCRLVVVADGGERMRGGLADDIVWHAPPDLGEVFRRVMKVRPGSDVLEGEDLTRVVDALRGCRVEEVVALAALRVPPRDATDPADPARPYVDQLRHIARRQVADMLAEPLPASAIGLRTPADVLLLPLYRRSLLLAAAVFHESPLGIIVRAGSDLHARLRGRPVSADSAIAAPVPPFADTSEELLAWLRAELVQENGNESAGASRGSPVVRFLNPVMPDVILESIWNDRHVAARIVVEWLDRWALAGDESDDLWELSMQAATAVGRLMCLDYESMKHQLEDWVGHNTLAGHRAVGWAAQVVIDDARLSSTMWDEVDAWREHDKSLFRYAALAVYAESMSSERVREALDLVVETTRTLFILRPGLRQLLTSVVRRAVELGACREAFEVLAGWLDTVEHVQRIRRRNDALPPVDRPMIRFRERVDGGLCDLVGFTLRVLGDADDRARARMLGSVREDDAVRAVHERVWRLALHWPSTSREALGQLKRWLELVGGDKEDAADLEAVCRVLLPCLARDPLLRRRLVFHAQRWAKEWGGEHAVAKQILSESLAMTMGAAS
jgi:hypothetical protein